MLRVEQRDDGIAVYGAEPFDLEQTLDCGQCFRFVRTAEGWSGAAGSHAATVFWENDVLRMRGVSPEAFEGFWRGYFDLDRSYTALREAFMADKGLAPCVAYAPGIRLLHQPAFEALICFILSQNNHVPRIKGIADRLCRLFGEPLGEHFAFPTPERLALCEEEELAPLRSGWRAGYILDAARRVAGGDVSLEEVARMPLDEARRELMRIRGVGPKVAECVLLYGMGRLEAFPMDVWMKRAMARLFPGSGPERFGPYAGIAQQFIFHYCRRHPEEVREASP